MNSKDQKNQARKIVSERLRSFFYQMQEKLTASTGELWKRVESEPSEEEKRPAASQITDQITEERPDEARDPEGHQHRDR